MLITSFVAATISLVTVAIVGPKGAESSALAANHPVFVSATVRMRVFAFVFGASGFVEGVLAYAFALLWHVEGALACVEGVWRFVERASAYAFALISCLERVSAYVFVPMWCLEGALACVEGAFAVTFGALAFQV